MEENTTTTNDTKTEGAESALPNGGTQDVAVNETTNTEVNADGGDKQEAQEGGDKPLPNSDEKLASFAKGQGIEDLSDLSPREMSLLKSAYDNKAEQDRVRQKATELEKTMSTMSDESAQQVAEATGQDPEVLKRLQRMEVKDSIRDFWETHPEARQYQQEMAKIASDSGLYGSPDAILKAAYAMAVANNQGAVKSQGKREALESLAQKQQAAVPAGNATNPGVTPKAKDFKDLSISEMEAKLGFARR